MATLDIDAKETLTKDMDEADAHVQILEELNIDLNVVGQELQSESLKAFSKYYQALIQSVTKRRHELEQEWHRMISHLGQYEPDVTNLYASKASSNFSNWVSRV